jgi:hypothetical protein
VARTKSTSKTANAAKTAKKTLAKAKPAASKSRPLAKTAATPRAPNLDAIAA